MKYFIMQKVHVNQTSVVPKGYNSDNFMRLQFICRMS